LSAQVLNPLARKHPTILFESPPSLRRQGASFPGGKCLIPSYVVGPQQESLLYLFSEPQLPLLAEHSPVVFYGPNATGKTSLAITLATRWSRLTGAKPLLLTTGEAFAAEYQEAVVADDVEHFRRRHRRVRLLVIDELDALEGKPAAQEELMSSLDVLTSTGCPVIATISRLPSSMRGIRPGLASRLVAGLTIPLALPATAIQPDVIAMLLATYDPALSLEPFLTLLGRINQPLSVPQLHSWVSFASHQRKLLGVVELGPLRDYLAALLAHEPPDLPTIAKAAARRFQVKLAELRGSTRQARVVRARGLAILLARRLTQLSLNSIGEYFGGRDHSTILHAARKIEEALPSDAELAVALLELQQELNSSPATL
jgi:chromosomal replication initiator protein